MRLLFLLVAAVVLVSPAAGMSAFFKRDLGVQGFIRYCEYSDGSTYTVNSAELCPMSVETGFGSSRSTRMMGFKAGEYQDGMTKVCVYNVLGEQHAIRLNGMGLCPLTYDF